jgi:hypothetical protein
VLSVCSLLRALTRLPSVHQVNILRPLLDTMDWQQVKWLCCIILKGAKERRLSTVHASCCESLLRS